MHLAQTQLIFHRKASFQQSPVYQKLRDLSHFYAEINEDVVSAKNRLHRALQLTFPELEQLFSKASGKQYWQIVQVYPHPQLVLNASHKALISTVKGSSAKHFSPTQLDEITTKLTKLAQQAYSAVSASESMVEQVRYHALEVARLTALKADIINEMTKLAADLPELSLWTSIPGIGETTAAILIGSIGDIRRFHSSNQVNAYVGIDLRHYESGKYVAADHISKRGNSLARKTLFRTIWSIVAAAKHQPNHINDFYQRKKSQSSEVSTKKIAIAAMHRLIRTMYCLVQTNQPYRYLG